MTRVLVVEDEESFSDALTFMLEREGYEVAVAADGNAAIEEFEKVRGRHPPARFDVARSAWHRSVSTDTNAVTGADHHAHREGWRG